MIKNVTTILCIKGFFERHEVFLRGRSDDCLEVEYHINLTPTLVRQGIVLVGIFEKPETRYNLKCKTSAGDEKQVKRWAKRLLPLALQLFPQRKFVSFLYLPRH